VYKSIERIELIQNTIGLLALLTAVTNFRLPEKPKIFVAS